MRQGPWYWVDQAVKPAMDDDLKKCASFSLYILEASALSFPIWHRAHISSRCLSDLPQHWYWVDQALKPATADSKSAPRSLEVSQSCKHA